MAGKANSTEKLRRALRTLYFVLTLAASLLTLSLPLLVAFSDVAAAVGLGWMVTCGCGGGVGSTCGGIKDHVSGYGFRRSLMDIPLVSIIRSVVITCVYCLCDGPGLSHGPYFGTVTVCSVTSIVVLLVKASLFSAIVDFEFEDAASSTIDKHRVKLAWAMSCLFFSSLVFAIGHVAVAYRTSCRARRKLLIYHLDPESVISWKNMFSGQKIPRSPTPGFNSKSDTQMKRKASSCDRSDPSVSLLADTDSKFIACQGLMVHYKLCSSESPLCRTLKFSPFHDPMHKPERHSLYQPETCFRASKSFSYQFHDSSLSTPLLLESSSVPSTPVFDDIPILKLDEGFDQGDSFGSDSMGTNNEEDNKFGVILVHGFGGGVFSWRHVMHVLSRQTGCKVVAFDRPGWGLTSRLHRKDWEDRQLPNPYKLESQVDLLISFCSSLGLSSVVFVGHDDGGLLALKTAEKLRVTAEPVMVEVKGIILVSASLSREIVPAFARILLHTSLGKKHMVRPLLRTEITQVINRHAWYDPTKLTTEVFNLYKAPLCIDGWDEALHEIGRMSSAMVLSPENAASLLESVEDIPVLVVAGAEDALVPLKSTQALAAKFANSRLVAISGCGHLPHEECPKALLSALSPFVTRLIPAEEDFKKTVVII